MKLTPRVAVVLGATSLGAALTLTGCSAGAGPVDGPDDAAPTSDTQTESEDGGIFGY